MPAGRSIPLRASGLALLLIVASCVNERELTPAEALADAGPAARASRAERLASERASAYLKAHMRNGDVYVLSGREFDTEAGQLVGEGVLLDFNRDTLAEGRFTVPIDSVALFETNQRRISKATVAMTLVTGASVALTVYCLINTKACFGSCPTFYAAAGDSAALQAEGFSASIAPSLEATDVDALYRARPEGRTVRVEMRNEALETHVVRHVDLLAAPRPAHGRVLAGGDGRFWRVPALHAPTACAAREGDCLPAVRAFDGDERFSPADSADLAARELVDLAFDAPTGALGLVVGTRQTLLSTFLLYQALAYMGEDAGAWLARLERSDRDLRGLGLGRILGGIEVLVEDGAGGWIVAGEVREHGPLATDVHLIPLPPLPSGATRVRLRLTRGNWRIDYLALAEMEAPVEPLRLRPAAVLRDGQPDEEARARLLDPTAALTTMPGDAYTLVYELPDGGGTSYELFLESRGYYLEWIREEWMKERDPERLARLLFTPRAALRELAPAYKEVEAEMENVFWRSRYARP